MLTLNLKCTDGYWSINITEPKDLPFLSNAEKLIQQKKFENALTKYLTVQSQKALALKNLNDAEKNRQIQLSSSTLLGSAAALKSTKKRYEFSIRSSGTFMMAERSTVFGLDRAATLPVRLSSAVVPPTMGPDIWVSSPKVP